MKHILFLTPLLAATPALAQDATPTPTPDAPEKVIVVTAERNPQPLTDTPSTVTVITRAQIEAKKAFDLVDILRLSPGVSVAQSGTQGKITSVFIRGANSNHTLVLIDGVRANSPADGGFDFGTIPADNVERIEILRGPQSALYGSDAIGGVINIITRSGSGPLTMSGGLEYGSDSTNKQVFAARGQVGKGGLSFSATRLSTDGDSNNDDYKNLGASLRYDMNVGASSKLAFTSRFTDAKLGNPGQTEFTLDPNSRAQPRQAFGGIEFTHNAAKRRDQVILGISDRKLDTNDPVNPGADPATASSSSGTVKSRVLSLDAQSAFSLGPHTLTVGGETRRDRAAIDSVFTFGGFPSPTNFGKTLSTNALFLQDEYRAGRFTFAPGVRYEHNSQYGGNTSGRLAAAYAIDSLSKFKLSYGTAFKAPSVDDLYYPGYGNPNLDPEKSKGYEIGYERTIMGTGHVELTAFRNKIRNLIAGVAVPTPADPFNFMAENINRAKTQGLELGLDLPIAQGIRAVVNQTFLQTDSTPRLLRRPRFTTSADLIAQRGKYNADLGVVAQGRRFDNDFQPVAAGGQGNAIYAGFSRLDFTLGYDVKPGLQVYGRFQNVLDRDYDEAAGFRAPGFNFVLGVKTAAF